MWHTLNLAASKWERSPHLNIDRFGQGPINYFMTFSPFDFDLGIVPSFLNFSKIKTRFYLIGYLVSEWTNFYGKKKKM